MEQPPKDESARLLYGIATTMGSLATLAKINERSPHREWENLPEKHFALGGLSHLKSQAVHLEQELLSRRIHRAYPNFIGNGAQSYTFRYGENGQFVIKLPYARYDQHPKQTLRDIVQPLKRGYGAANLEQLVAYSEDKPIAVVTNYIPGKTLFDLRTRERMDITPEAFAGLLHTYGEMHRRGLSPDNGSSRNTIWTPNNNFAVIDYAYFPGQTLEDMALTFGDQYNLLSGPHADGPPPFALTYRAVCKTELGTEMAQRLDEYWHSVGIR